MPCIANGKNQGCGSIGDETLNCAYSKSAREHSTPLRTKKYIVKAASMGHVCVKSDDCDAKFGDDRYIYICSAKTLAVSGLVLLVTLLQF